MTVLSYSIKYALYHIIIVEIILIAINVPFTNHCNDITKIQANSGLHLSSVIFVFTVLCNSITLGSYYTMICRHYDPFKTCKSLIIILGVTASCVYILLIEFLIILYSQGIDSEYDQRWEMVTYCNFYLIVIYVTQSAIISVIIINVIGSLAAFSRYYKNHRLMIKKQVI